MRFLSVLQGLLILISTIFYTAFDIFKKGDAILFAFYREMVIFALLLVFLRFYDLQATV
jgi:hypothetical protein